MTPPILQRVLTTDGVQRCAAMGAASDWGWVHMLGVVLKVMVLRREGLPELGQLQMGIGVLG